MDKKLNRHTDPKEIQKLIRQEFNYLTTSYGFVELIDSTIDNFYSQVKFKKNNWILSIVTISHGSKISIRLESPNGDMGFLHYYFKISDNQYEKSERLSNNLDENIKFNSSYLKQYGKDILEGDNLFLIKIFELLETEHEKWVKPLLKTK